ncbi:DEKNAAC101356 [Brettanomyces naardenensis]|uniref:DEKNAAC101356 n=1 Tax=Brettanomyces naardenensis TaxID=13370 RepID=A0A448YHT9_BRENA|nr:DEKNAAC101356 [Brettanomyces naardenensis]
MTMSGTTSSSDPFKPKLRSQSINGLFEQLSNSVNSDTSRRADSSVSNIRSTDFERGVKTLSLSRKSNCTNPAVPGSQGEQPSTSNVWNTRAKKDDSSSTNTADTFKSSDSANEALSSTPIQASVSADLSTKRPVTAPAPAVSASDTFDTSKFYEMLGPKGSPSLPSWSIGYDSVSSSPSSVSTPQTLSGSAFLHPSSRIGRNSVHSATATSGNTWTLSEPVEGITTSSSTSSSTFAWKLTRFGSQSGSRAVDDMVLVDRKVKVNTRANTTSSTPSLSTQKRLSQAAVQPTALASSASLTSSPVLWATVPPPSIEDTPTSGIQSRTSRFFPSPMTENRAGFPSGSTSINFDDDENDVSRANSVNGAFTPAKNVAHDLAARSNSATGYSASSSPLNFGFYPSGSANSTSMPAGQPFAESLFEGFSLGSSIHSVQQPVTNVLDGPRDVSNDNSLFLGSPSPSPMKPRTSTGTRNMTQTLAKRVAVRSEAESRIPSVSEEELRSFIAEREHPGSFQARSVEEPDIDEEQLDSDLDYQFSLPKVKLQPTEDVGPAHSRVIKYIRTIITRQPTQYMIYIASLPYDTPSSQCHNLVRQAFKNYGEITHLVKDEHSKSSKVSPENDLFIRFRIVVKLFNEQKLPYKSHRFFNEVTGRDSKMLLFFDCSSSSPTGHLDQGNGYGGGYSKQDVSSYPEGFASTFHRRGANNFMFVRELQSKMIINKVRLNSNVSIESAEFRVSLPIEELNLGLSHDASWEGPEKPGVSKAVLRSTGDDFRRFKRSYIVSIDVRELENKPVFHASGKPPSTDDTTGKRYYYGRSAANRSYNSRRNGQ